MIRLTTEIQRSPRVMQIEGMFDIDSAEKSVTEIPLEIPDLNEREWNVGLIVGPSGAGKTTVANQMFKQQMTAAENLKWSKDKSLVDDFPKTMSIQDITTLLSSVGFSSPPSWLRPFHALSNGEQFRVSMARLLAEQQDLAVVDEFTSVVDRTVAQVGAYAVAKTVRKRNQKLVAVTCHYDVEEWLQPDWIYEPATGSFRWESVRQRPPIEITFIRSTPAAWNHFSRHHYLDHTIATSAAIVVGLINNQPAVLIGTKAFPHPHINNLWQITRIVVMPDFQGLGLAHIAMNLVGGAYTAKNKILNIVTSHPAFLRSLDKSETWKMIRKPSRILKPNKYKVVPGGSSSGQRITATFQYVGKSDNTLLNLY